VFLTRVLRERVGRGLRAGIVAAAATAGVLIGFGIARGAPLRPLNAVAHLVLGTRAYLTDGFHAAITPLALALHVLAAVVWAELFVLITPRLRGIPLFLAALAFAGAIFVVDVVLLPRGARPGFEQALTAGEQGIVYLVFGLALALALQRPADSRA
jgi:hypothetical protein